VWGWESGLWKGLALGDGRGREREGKRKGGGTEDGEVSKKWGVWGRERDGFLKRGGYTSSNRGGEAEIRGKNGKTPLEVGKWNAGVSRGGNKKQKERGELRGPRRVTGGCSPSRGIEIQRDRKR